MRLAFLTGGAPLPGWAETPYEWILTRARGYQENGHDILVLAPPSKSAPAEYDLSGVRFRRVSSAEGSRLLREFAPDALLVHHAHTSQWAADAARSLPFPKVFWMYGPEVLPPSAYYYKPDAFSRFFLNFLDSSTARKLKRFYSTARRFVCTSRYTAEKLAEFLPGAKGEVIYNPVELPVSIHPAREEPLKGLAIELFEHRLLLGAGFDLLIQAYRGTEGMSLTLAGSGEAAGDLGRWIAREKSGIELRVIDFKSAGSVGLYEEHDYFVVASRLERQLFRACKAMARGLPVLAPDAQAFPEAVIPGQTGATFAPENPLSLREGLKDLRENYLSLRQGALKWVEGNCSPQKVISKELQLLAAL